MTRFRLEDRWTWTPHGYERTPPHPRITQRCPHCGAEPYRRCRTHRGVEIDDFHPSRPWPPGETQ